MVLSFKDGTRVDLPNGSQAHNFIQFDLPWLVYVHGEVTSFNAGDESSKFKFQIPRSIEPGTCTFC
ncbi:MAG: hypothetical protein DMG65_19940 [Candidatus Angelobacter sp. Gp1-AA117]|nr:MAG: hypothetical protein DMG65_19940 [Candidatus Angelobacter sp. Gp1-AA117]